MLEDEGSLNTGKISHSCRSDGVCFLIVVGILLLALLLISGGGEGRTIIVDDDGEGEYTRIQDAIDNSTDGDTIRVWEGVYYENVVVDRSIIIEGNDSASRPVVNGMNMSHALMINSNDVIISNLSLVNATRSDVYGMAGIFAGGIRNVSLMQIVAGENTHGLFVENGSDFRIIDCNFSSNHVGFHFQNSSRIEVELCDANNNTVIGSVISGCDSVTLSGSNLNSNGAHGIMIFNSNSTVIRFCSIRRGGDGGIYLDSFHNDTMVMNNSITDCDHRGIEVRGAFGGTISGNTISRIDGAGISFTSGGDITTSWNITGNEISGNRNGIYVGFGKNNRFADNIVVNNSIGIHIGQPSAQENIFRNNSILNNSIGVEVYDYFPTNIDLRYNWWGDPSGPHHDVKNPDGKGNPIDSFVWYRPWIGDGSKPIFNENSGKHSATIQEAINDAEPGSTIIIPDGRHYETRIRINKSITVRSISSDASTSIIDGNGEGSIFIIESEGVTIQGLTMTGSHRANFQETSEQAAIAIYRNECNIFGNVFKNNSNWAILLDWGANGIVIEDNSFEKNLVGVYLTTNVNISVHNNSFIDNVQFGIDNDFSNKFPIDASMNFWGDGSGPFHSSFNSNGQGDNITDFIIFEPWLDGNGNPVERLERGGSERDRMFIPIIITGILSVSLLGIALHREDLRFLLLSLMALPLYSRMERSDILDQSTRNDVYTEVSIKPGVNYSAIKKKLGLGTSSLVYHLEVLEREGYIRSKKEMGRKMFFPKSTGIPTDSTSIPVSTTLPPSPVQKKIIEYLKDSGQKTPKEIEEALELKRQTVSYSIRNLKRKGLVKTGGKGRNDPCELVEK